MGKLPGVIALLNEQCVIVKQRHHVGLAIQILELVQDFDDCHRYIPPHEGGDVGHYILIELAESCSHNILQR